LSPRFALGAKTESADKTSAQIADDVAEHVFSYEHRIILRILEHPHADRVDVRVIGADVGIILGYVLEATHHQAAGLAQHIWFLDQRDAFATGFLCVLERFFADIRATCLLMMRVESAMFSSPALSFHFFISGLRTTRCKPPLATEKFHAAVHTLGVFPEHD